MLQNWRGVGAYSSSRRLYNILYYIILYYIILYYKLLYLLHLEITNFHLGNSTLFEEIQNMRSIVTSREHIAATSKVRHERMKLSNIVNKLRVVTSITSLLQCLLRSLHLQCRHLPVTDTTKSFHSNKYETGFSCSFKLSRRVIVQNV